VSLYSALYAGVSGLSAQASAMATVADNITNVNTIGYKGVSADFKTLVAGGRGASYAAGGVVSTPQAMISKQGQLQTGSSLTDIGIDGNGFFVVRSGASPDSEIAYTRAGSFKTDRQGFLRNTAGFYLQGWPLDTDGNYVNTGNLDQLQPIRPNILTGSASPTTRIEARINLSSTTPDFAGTYAVGDMAGGDAVPQFSRPMDVYDAQGSAHRVIMGFIKTGPNEWQAEIYAQPATDVDGVTDGLLASGEVLFNGDGSLDLDGSTAALFADLDIEWTNGAASVPIRLGLGSDGGLDGLTSFDDVSGLLRSDVDGGTLGTVSSVEISDEGVVTAVFEDGSSRAIYQLPIATVQNPDGLTRIAGNAYQISQDSGNVAINPPNSLGSGKISAGMLEASNADLATEFTNMIRFQRAYSASSKIITTVDDMLQEVSNLKR
jgi:flagellar hook protein FlgE